MQKKYNDRFKYWNNVPTDRAPNVNYVGYVRAAVRLVNISNMFS